MLDLSILNEYDIDFIEIAKQIRRNRRFEKGLGYYFIDREYLELYNYYINNYYDQITTALRFLDNYYSKLKRLRKKFKMMVNRGNCLFLTLTFEDSVLERTSKETRRRYVSRFLNHYDTFAVANIDFGEKNDREHYHAFIQIDKVNHLDWSYGALNFERFRYNDNGVEKLSTYISKVAFHALKDSTKNGRLIHIRPKRINNELHCI